MDSEVEYNFGKKYILPFKKEVLLFFSPEHIKQIFKPKFKEIPIKKENFEIVIKGLFKVVNEGGTGRSAKVEGLDICGKTGTSQIIAKENPDYKKLVKNGKYICRACGRVAESESNLCVPEEL